MTSLNVTSAAEAYLLKYNRFLVPISGFISPLFILINASATELATIVFILITLITNAIICVILLSPNLRSPTSILLVAIATSDALTGLWSVPVSVYLFLLGAYRDWLPHSWCFVYFCLSEHLPTVFHTASIWLTVGLAAQRYNYVCRPVSARRLCTTASVVRLVLVVFVVATGSQVCRFVESTFTPVLVVSRTRPNQVLIYTPLFAMKGSSLETNAEI